MVMLEYLNKGSFMSALRVLPFPKKLLLLTVVPLRRYSLTSMDGVNVTPPVSVRSDVTWVHPQTPPDDLQGLRPVQMMLPLLFL